MVKLICAFYGDDVYDHDNKINDWGRVRIDSDDEQKIYLDKYTEQLDELFIRKRICWYNIFLLEMSEKEVVSTPLLCKYAPLRQRIVLNEVAKEDMLKAKTKCKSFDEIVEEVQAAAVFAAPPVVGNGIQYAMFEQPVVNPAFFNVAANP